MTLARSNHEVVAIQNLLAGRQIIRFRAPVKRIRQIDGKPANRVHNLLNGLNVAHNVLCNAHVRNFADGLAFFRGTRMRGRTVIGTFRKRLIIRVMERIIRLAPGLSRASRRRRACTRQAGITRAEIATPLHVICIARHGEQRNRSSFGINAHKHLNIGALDLFALFGPCVRTQHRNVMNYAAQ